LQATLQFSRNRFGERPIALVAHKKGLGGEKCPFSI
jgi:hypothetical protein